MSIEIRFVTLPQEREEIYRFRYKIYVEEMGRLQLYADHERKLIYEPLDDTAHLLAAYENEGNSIIGTLRQNYTRESELGYYSELYEMCKSDKFNSQNTSITTKLMIKSEYRKTNLVIRLAKAGYAQGIRDKIRYDFIDVNVHLVNLFMKLGYRVHKNVNHPEYGDVTVMLLDFEDIDHFEMVKSPFRKEYYAFQKYHKSVII